MTAESYIGADEIYYAYYMKHVSGPFTQESYDWLEAQGEEFAPMLEASRRWPPGNFPAMRCWHSPPCSKNTVYTAGSSAGT